MKICFADYTCLAIFLRLFEDISPSSSGIYYCRCQSNCTSVFNFDDFVIFSLMFCRFIACLGVDFFIFLFWVLKIEGVRTFFFISGKFSMSISSNIASPPFYLILFLRNSYQRYFGAPNLLSSLLPAFLLIFMCCLLGECFSTVFWIADSIQLFPV